MGVIKLLVKKGADIHQAKCDGLTPLQIAALCGQNEVVDYLMSKGAIWILCLFSPPPSSPSSDTQDCSIRHSSKQHTSLWHYPAPQHLQTLSIVPTASAVLVEARARYIETAKREIEEKITEFGMQNNAGNGGAGPSAPRG